MPTWWCGQPVERDYVLANLHRLVLRSAHRHAGEHPVFGDSLSQAELASWRERIRARPHRYVGQEQHIPSSVPTLKDGLLEPRPAILRAFLVARQDTYVVMPGGLTRVGARPDSRIISNQAGAISKDTWVLASEPEQIESLLPPEQMPFRAAEETLPGTTAENLYWVARYMVRVESTIRLIRNIHLRRNEVLQLDDPVTRTTLEILLRSLTHVTRTYPGFTGSGSAERLSNPLPEILDLITNARRTGTLAANLTAFLTAAYAVRDLVSSDTRRVVNEIGDELAGLEGGDTPHDLQHLQDVMDRIITALMAITGATGESMSRELGWQFLGLGRRIERSLLLISLVRAVLVEHMTPDIEALVLESVLTVEESFTLYRRRHRHRPRIEATLDLLLLDESNARSLAYQIRELHRHIAALPGQGERPRKKELRLMIEASTRLSLADAETLATGDGGMRSRLELLLASIGQSLCNTSDALSESYFTHAEVPYQLLDGGADAR